MERRTKLLLQASTADEKKLLDQLMHAPNSMTLQEVGCLPVLVCQVILFHTRHVLYMCADVCFLICECKVRNEWK
jgi:hypothetical protein